MTIETERIQEDLLPLAIDINSPILDPRNAREHPEENIDHIKLSLLRYGQCKPVVVNKNTGIIEAGNGMVVAARELGWRRIAVARADHDSVEAMGYGLMDNKSGLSSTWDLPQLKDNLLELDTGAFDMKYTGFSEQEIEELMTQFHPDNVNEGLTADDVIPEEVETICKTGDLWKLGKHRLLCGDATKKEDVERLMGGEKAVLMATDPPYGDSWVEKAKDMNKLGYGHSRAVLHGYVASDDVPLAELKTFLDTFLAKAKYAGDPPFPAYVWHRAKRMLFEQAMLDAGYLVHQPIVWLKPSFVIGRLHYHPRCEWALHGWLKGGGECPFYGERNQSDVWEIGRENDGLHPTQKPVALFEIPIKNHTRTDDICYEPFAGSGTQAIACEKLKHHCYMMEIDEHYCDVIIKRWEDYTGLQAEKIE